VKTILLCDQKWRDLPNLCAIKVILERLGNTALISATKDAFAQIVAFRPDVVVFNHMHSERYRTLSRVLKESGRIVVVLPTEGTMRPEFEPIGTGEFSDYSDVDVFLAWNDTAADEVRRRWSKTGIEVQTIGCTRFDFHHPRFVNAVTTREALCAKWKLDPSRPIVTWATAYGYSELNGLPKSDCAQFEREAIEVGIKECLQRIGIDLFELPAIVSEGREAAAEAFFEAAKVLREIQFVIKPHPREDRGYYERRLAETRLPNVRLCPRDYIWNTLRVADVHLHRHCTTAVEAWMWQRPTIEMGMDKHRAFAWPEREAGSDIADDAKSLIELVRYRLATSLESTLLAYRSKYIHAWFGAADGRRCEAAADTIHQYALQHRTRSSRRICGLGISYRDAAIAVLRRWLNHTPTESLTGHSRSTISRAEDRWIRRSDITDYERMLRTQVFV
jgi:hypothetical protein